ncbi:arabinogalactan protein 14-like [Mangifera indica]|uniref:arabinogalactan protein 14-like n=1 Tax=Mangifera indica TaxID=29780 RepID=UPI001CFACFA2|nr:arabinogalactan protein 14-like [Mangifera indica]
MEAMKMNFLVVLMGALMMVAAFSSVKAADTPAPSPTSDAAVFMPSFIASLMALAFGFFF